MQQNKTGGFNLARAPLAAAALALAALVPAAAADVPGPRSRVIEDGGTGPYTAVMTEVAGFAEHTVFRPMDLSPFSPENPLPVLVWGNGACANSPIEHAKFLSEIASHGYLVLATGLFPETDEPYRGPMSRPEQQIESIDWAFAAQDGAAGDEYCGRIDVKKICLAGMSCGGLQALHNCADKRVTAVMICNSGLFTNRAAAMPNMPMPEKSKLKELHTPVIYILGGEPDIAYGNGMDDFHRIDHVPAIAANLPVGHGGTFGRTHGGEFAVVARLWLDWQLKGDRAAAKMFLGEDCLLKSRQGWTIEKNGLVDCPAGSEGEGAVTACREFPSRLLGVALLPVAPKDAELYETWIPAKGGEGAATGEMVRLWRDKGSIVVHTVFSSSENSYSWQTKTLSRVCLVRAVPPSLTDEERDEIEKELVKLARADGFNCTVTRPENFSVFQHDLEPDERPWRFCLSGTRPDGMRLSGYVNRYSRAYRDRYGNARDVELTVSIVPGDDCRPGSRAWNEGLKKAL